MSPLYTRTGDQGTTSLVDGSRLSKTDLRFETIGTIDELNTQIGAAIALIGSQPLSHLAIQPSSSKDQWLHGQMVPWLTTVQSDLFSIGAYLAQLESPDTPPVSDARVTQLEEQIDAWTEAVPKLNNFILPGGSPASAQLHVVRAVSRRAERALICYHNQQAVAGELLRYLNRLADYWFAAARFQGHIDGGPETRWSGGSIQ